MTHEQRTAELALHGWRPVLVADGWGVISDMAIGYYTRPSLLNDMATGLPILSPVFKIKVHDGECAWSDIPEEALEKIEEWLATV